MKNPLVIKHSNITGGRVVGQKQVIKRALGFVLFFLLITSFTPNIAFSGTEFTQEYIAYSAINPIGIIADDSGFMIPVNPQTGEADRSSMSDKITHTVKSGETISTIAAAYGLRTSTLLWENNLSQNSVLRVGRELVIPPVDGVTHEVQSGQSIDRIATLYEVDKDSIIRQNGLDSETISAGQSIFVPGGEKLAPPAPKPVVVASSPSYRSTTVARTESVTRTNLEATTATPAAGKSIIFPTRGQITQGYHSWHRAIDIADRGRPPVWAAANGTVVKASSGTWGGGYGNHVIIDHGNGMQTLYAHLGYLTVSNGQHVTQGEVIGQMGNTGRVYGATGIHLHFEVRENGIKQVPSYYW